MKSELLPFVLLCAACAAGESDGEEVARRDSAGVVILEHAEAEPRSTWRLADGPFLRIESNEADTAELLYRVAGAVAMRDGIAVANGGARQVWLYDGEARLRWRAGRAGEGPGEFQDVAALFGIAGDSLLAYDTRLRRFQVLAPGGALTRTFQLDGPSSSGPPRGAFPIGVVAARLLIVQTVRPPATVA